MKKNNEGLMTRIRNVVAKDGGFTLIEVLAVMVIVGLLAAIAIPQISKWREKAHVTALKTDARSLSQALEAYYVDNAKYPDETDVTGAADAATFTIDGDTIQKNKTVSLTAYEPSADGESFTFTLANSKAPGKTVTYDSAAGGLQD